MNQTNALGTEKMGHLLFRLAMPAVIAQIINLLYNIVDRIYIGHIAGIGTAALTGVGLFMPILMLINSFASMIGAGGAPLASMALGRKDQKHAQKILSASLAALLVLAIILTVVLFAGAPVLLRFFGASDTTLPYALTYSRIYIIGTITVMLVMGLNPFISAQGYAKTAMLSTVIGAVINIALDPLLIFTFHMGVAGAAAATVISQVVYMIWILHFLGSEKSVIRFHKKEVRLDMRILKPVVGLGVSTFVMISTESLLSIAFNRSLSIYGGDIAVGAMTIITSIVSLLSMPLQGICQGGQPIISYNYGAHHSDRVKEAVRLMLIVNLIWSSLFWVLMMFFPSVSASLFTNDAGLIGYAVPLMRIYFALCFSNAFQITCQQGFVALGQAKISLFMACLRKLILLIPLILLLPLFLPDKVIAVFLAEPIADALAAFITAAAFFHRLPALLK